jgi:2TM domain
MSHHPVTPMSAEDELLARARKRVGKKMGFYTHALVFVMVNLGLYLVTSQIPGARWTPFPLWGWALGLAIHGLVTFLDLSGEGLRERMLAQEVARLRERG